MPIDAEKLLNFEIPRVRQKVTPRDAAFYALSVGMGHDDAHRAQQSFIDPLAGPLPMPSMTLVMAHPGFWLGHPDSGVDPVAVLHGRQSIAITGALPVDAEVESETRITGLIDKGPGKAALILTETQISDATGLPFARLDRTTFIRGGGGFGGSDAPISPAPPTLQGEPALSIDLATRREQALLYRLNGDLNPLHSDPDIAARAGFERPILHGLCTMGFILHAILRGCLDYRPDRLRSVSLRFAAPVLPGETIRTEIWNDGSFRARVVERDLIVADEGRFDAILPNSGTEANL
ncbi:MaoC/PaaZ C-terminal domain-containing protein [Sphingobium sp.]|uniref:MaoC/PaaZ C-terminal domain-containing protein n=1 Tax=Sphingobium sp. TaxID=1912891 RepID=UPI0028BE7684|nr:MaoC/PaaZ C-terminal domain-containing protein [Sphingobium sp.]